MGRRSGSGGGGYMPGDATYNGRISNVETLKNIKDPKLYKEMKEAISRFSAVLGIPQRNIKLATLDGGTFGVHVTANGASDGIYLNKKYFKNAKLADVIATHKKNYNSGWSTKTNRPGAHTITHELAHAVWNSALRSPKAQAAAKEIFGMYKKWMGDSKKTGYGKYSKTNVNEFWAETITKGIHGKSDKYTKKAISIAKKYKL